MLGIFKIPAALPVGLTAHVKDSTAATVPFAQLFRDKDHITAFTANPAEVDPNGEFYFYADDGWYQVVLGGEGTPVDLGWNGGNAKTLPLYPVVTPSIEYNYTLADATIDPVTRAAWIDTPEPGELGVQIDIHARMSGLQVMPFGIGPSIAAFFFPVAGYCESYELYPAAVTGVEVELVGTVLHIRLDEVTPPTHLAIFQAVATYMNRPYALVDIENLGYDPATEPWDGGGPFDYSLYPDGTGASWLNEYTPPGIRNIPYNQAWWFEHGGTWAGYIEAGVQSHFDITSGPNNDPPYYPIGTVHLIDDINAVSITQGSARSDILDASLSLANRNDGVGNMVWVQSLTNPDGTISPDPNPLQLDLFFGDRKGVRVAPGTLTKFNVYSPGGAYGPHTLDEPEVVELTVRVRSVVDAKDKQVPFNDRDIFVTADADNPTDMQKELLHNHLLRIAQNVPFIGKADITDGAAIQTSENDPSYSFLVWDRFSGDALWKQFSLDRVKAAIGTTPNHVPSGFPDHDSTTLSMVQNVGAVNDTFSVTITGTNFPVFINGVHRTKNTETIEQVGALSKRYYIFYAADGTFIIADTPWSLDPGEYAGEVPICTVLWDAQTHQGILEEERHHSWRDVHWHHWAHHTIGSRYSSAHTANGLNLVTPAVGSTSTSAFSMTGGDIYDEDIVNNTIAATACDVYYHHTNGKMTWIAQQAFPWLSSTGAATGVPQYDNGANAVANKTASNTQGYFVSWVYATNAVGQGTTPRIAVVVGQDADANMTLAEAQNAGAPSLPTDFIVEWKLCWKIIYRYGAGPALTWISNTDYRTAGTLPGGQATVTNVAANAVTYSPTAPDTSTNAQTGLDTRLLASGGTITNYKETILLTTTSGNVTLDLANGNVQRFILDAARQFTMPADPGAVGQSFVLIIECATYTPTWNASPTIEWLTSDGAAPTLVTTANLVNVLTFIWDDVDSRWLGFLAGKETA